VTVPIAVLTWQQRRQLGWLGKPGWADLVKLVTMLSGSRASIVLIAALGAAGAVHAGGRARRAPASSRPAADKERPAADKERRATGKERRATAPLLTWLSAPWLFLPPAVLLAVSEIKPLYVFRYIVFCLPALALLTGAGLAALGRFWRIAAVAMIVLLALPMQNGIRRPGGHGDDIRSAARFVQTQARPGDAVIFYRYAMRDWAQAYPYGFTRLRDIGLGLSGAAAGNLSGTEVAVPVLERRLRHVGRVWLVEVSHNWPDSAVIGPPRFRLARVWLVSDLVLRLYARASPTRRLGSRHLSR